MTERIRIKAGHLELEWESDGPLSIENVKSLLREIEALPAAQPAQLPPFAGRRGEGSANEAGARANQPQKLFVTSIAAKLAAKSGADLARSAAAYLQLAEGKDSFSRQELLEAMKKAPLYYKTDMRKNLSRIIASLIPDKLNQIGENAFSLTAKEHAALETALA